MKALWISLGSTLAGAVLIYFAMGWYHTFRESQRHLQDESEQDHSHPDVLPQKRQPRPVLMA